MSHPRVPVGPDEARAIARLFPVLRPYLERTERLADLDELVAREGGRGARQALALVCHLYHPGRPWAVGPFVLREAICVWDHEQLAAFAAWAAEGEP